MSGHEDKRCSYGKMEKSEEGFVVRQSTLEDMSMVHDSIIDTIFFYFLVKSTII
jgi:hypothetical protein